MSVNRGDLVLVGYPFTTGGAKVRPALVVQNDRDNARMMNTIVAQVFDNAARVNLSLQPWREGPRQCAGSLAADWAEVGDRIMEAIYLEPKTRNGIGRR
jgi:mRNA-degrading endonuclease toxin of MazEF toxin-antitoxin module